MRVSKPLRKQIAEFAQLLHCQGWVANHDGNVSARDGNLFAATPTATSKRIVSEANVVEFDATGVIVGAGKLFGEIGLHLAVYERRIDVGAVIHAHPPNATAVACSGTNLIEAPFIAEAIVSLGPRIPCTQYATPGVEAKAALAPWCEIVDAVLLGNHGVVTWGADLEQAFLRMELVEHLATIAIAATPLGGVRALPGDAVNALLVARSKAGLGKAAERALETAPGLMRLAAPDMERTKGTLGSGAPDMERTKGALGSGAPDMERTKRMLGSGAPDMERTKRMLGSGAPDMERTKRTLGSEAVTACAPAPHSPVRIAGDSSRESLSDLIRQEIVAALK
jgi:L-fuculose-phosphate aldolase